MYMLKHENAVRIFKQENYILPRSFTPMGYMSDSVAVDKLRGVEIKN